MPDRRNDEHEEWAKWSEQPSEGIRVVGGRPADPPTPGGRFVLPGDPVEPTHDDRWVPDPSAGRGTELQHWADPPTGEVPRVLGGGTPDDDFDTWASVTGQGPRFRSGDADWADADWGQSDLKDETMGVGSLSDVDEVAPPRRRGRGGRGRHRGQEPAPEELREQREQRETRGFLEGPPRPTPSYDDYADDYGEGRDENVDITQRLITGAVMAAVAIAAFAAGRGVTILLATLIVGMAAFELYNALQRSGYHPATAIGLLGCLAIVPMAYSSGVTFQAFPLAMFLVVAFTLFWYLFEVVHARPTINISLTLLPFGWIGVFGAFAGLLLAPDPSGTGLLLGVVICAVGSDIAAYFVGRSMGRTPMFPKVSPNKTMEGLVGGSVAAVVLGAMVGTTLHPWADKGIGAGIMLGFLVAIMAPLGDLVSSLVKRDLGIKDFGTFLPGHGGILDRFDAILFCLPVGYYWAQHLFT